MSKAKQRRVSRRTNVAKPVIGEHRESLAEFACMFDVGNISSHTAEVQQMLTDGQITEDDAYDQGS